MIAHSVSLCHLQKLLFRHTVVRSDTITAVSTPLNRQAALLVMPPVRSARNRKPPPDGFDDIEDTLLEFGNKMKDAENASHEGKKRHEVLWPIFQISHQREQTTCLLKQQLTQLRQGSKYIYELYYEKEAISKPLYEWLLKNGYADANLIAKWKKQGYEKVWALPHSSLLQDG